MISAIAGAKLTHVPFAGGESIITAVPGRRVEGTCDAVAALLPEQRRMADKEHKRFVEIAIKISLRKQ